MSQGLEQQLITQLASAAKAVLLYPPQHQARMQPLQRTGAILEQMLKRATAAYIAIEEDILVANGTPFFDPFPGYAELMDRMSERGIKRIEFSPTLRGDELRVLVAMLALPAEDLKTNWESPRPYLEKQNVSSIALELDDEDLERRALKVYTEAKNYIVGLWDEARLGRIPKGDKARSTMHQLGQLLGKDPNLILGLTMLSDYDNYTFNHSVNVGVFALALAEELGFRDEREQIGLGGMLHDIGKTRIPLEIINKPGRLSDDEWQQMKRHPEISGEIVQQMGLNDVFDTVYQHHCGFNRRGYPELAPRKELNEGGQITAVCDVYDSVTTLRPYQRQHTPQEGIQVLLKLKANGHLNPAYVDSFVRTLGIYPIGTAVRLSTGEIALVTAVHRDNEDRPKVKIVRDARGNILRIPIDVDLAATGNAAGETKRRIVGTLDPAAIGIRISDFLDPQRTSAAR